MHFFLREMHYYTVTYHYHIFILRVMDNMTEIQNYSNLIIDIDNKNEYNYSNSSNCSIDTDNRKESDCVVGCTVITVVSVFVTLGLALMIFFLQQWIRNIITGMHYNILIRYALQYLNPVLKYCQRVDHA